MRTENPWAKRDRDVVSPHTFTKQTSVTDRTISGLLSPSSFSVQLQIALAGNQSWV